MGKFPEMWYDKMQVVRSIAIMDYFVEIVNVAYANKPQSGMC